MALTEEQNQLLDIWQKQLEEMTAAGRKRLQEIIHQSKERIAAAQASGEFYRELLIYAPQKVNPDCLSAANCPLVQIEWEDSARPIPAWQHLSDMAKNKSISCVSVGYLLQDDDAVKVLAPNMGDIHSELNIQASGIITIPTGCVTKISKLVEES